MEPLGRPISRVEALQVSRSIIERAEQERRISDSQQIIDFEQLALGKNNLLRWASRTPCAEWAQALLNYIAFLETGIQTGP